MEHQYKNFPFPLPDEKNVKGVDYTGGKTPPIKVKYLIIAVLILAATCGAFYFFVLKKENINESYTSQKCDEMPDVANVQDEVVKEKDQCYLQVGRVTGDLSVCDKIKLEWIKAQCYSWVAAKRKDLSICDNLHPLYQVNYCYPYVAIETGDLSVCDKIDSIRFQRLKDECYSSVAFKNRDTYICDRIMDSDIRNNCYPEIAGAKKDLLICDKIQNQYQDERDKCFLAVAKMKQESSICERIQNQTIKGFCYDLTK